MTYDPTFNHVDNKASLNYISNQLEYNLSEFLDYGFVSAGGFINVKASGDNIYGVAPYKLYPVNDPNYKNGQVWQTVRKIGFTKVALVGLLHTVVWVKRLYI